jgi:hypothetical protein
MYKIPSQACRNQKDSAMILVARGNQQAQAHPEGMDGGWTGKHFFIGFLFTGLPGWSPQLLFLIPTLLTIHSMNQCSGLFLHKKKHLFCVPWYSKAQNNQQQPKKNGNHPKINNLILI